MVEPRITCCTPPLMPKEIWCDKRSCAATANLFILTTTLQPKQVSTNPTITGRRAGSFGSTRSSSMSLWKGYMRAEAKYVHRFLGMAPFVKSSVNFLKWEAVEGLSAASRRSS